MPVPVSGLFPPRKPRLQFSMDDQYTQRIIKIEAELERWLPKNPDPAWAARVFPGLKNAVAFPLLKSLVEPGSDLLGRGGKRWRPLLMTLVCESLGGGDAAISLTPLVEFCHNASLIHDDIEDNSDERRGKPAAHIVYGEDRAINSGAFLYFLSLSCLENWPGPAETRGRIWSIWGRYMRRLHLGQAMDIHWHRDFSSLPDIDEYYTMCALKTGCLARLAAVLGVHAAPDIAPDARAALEDTLGSAAEQFGVGFQILDDVKNLGTGIPGKKRGDDIVEGKKSLPVLLYLHRRPERREFTARCFAAARKGGAGVPETEALIGELEKAGVLAEAEEKGLSLIRESNAVFSGAGCETFLKGPEKALLAGFFNVMDFSIAKQ
jgi:octaprenyl-diphosphate synthase